MLRRWVFFTLFIGIILLAVFLRFYSLDLRVFHHDEAAVGYFTYKLFKEGTYSYNPAFHGPFMYYSTSAVFQLLGDSDYTSRILPALLGEGMLLLVFTLRNRIGDLGVLISAWFFAVSPSFLYYSRFFREDIPMAFFTLAFVVFGVKYFEYRPSSLRILYLILGATALALAAGTKENAYITIAIFISFGFLYVVREKACSIKKSTLLEILVFLLIFFLSFSLLYTGKPFELEGMGNAVTKAIAHWYEMHSIARIGGPPFFYFPLLALYELPILIFGLLGIKHFYAKDNLLITFLSYWALTSLIIYSYLQEKVPWLIVHMLLPLTIIAGAYLGEILPLRNHRKRAVLFGVLILASTYSLSSSILLNYNNYTDPAEPMIQAAQPPQKFKELLTKIYEVASQYNGKSTEIRITDSELNTQFLWYLRRYNNVYYNTDINSSLNSPLIVVHDVDAEKIQNRLPDYGRLDSAKMSWYWFQPGDITLNYILKRKMNRAPDEYRVVLFYREKG